MTNLAHPPRQDFETRLGNDEHDALRLWLVTGPTVCAGPRDGASLHQVEVLQGSDSRCFCSALSLSFEATLKRTTRTSDFRAFAPVNRIDT